MYKETNRFGTDILYESKDLIGKINFQCCACMSIYAEGLSFSNEFPERISMISEANNVIILSCQVTDLAILNDLLILEKYMKEYPNKNFFIGGCLARRFDIPLPNKVKRIDSLKFNYTNITNFSFSSVNYHKPFWVKNWKEFDNDKKQGHLFRNMYPLRIGVGCGYNCEFCTIKDTRGKHHELLPSISEFENNDNILLVADSPSPRQLKEWIKISLFYKKSISIRNVEPHVTMAVIENLINLSKKNLLPIFHSPIQSPNPNVLKDMNRNVKATLNYIDNVNKLRKNTFIATNIIIDYKDFKNPSMTELNKQFDYISWNPLWNGVWDRKLAENRFNHYFK